MTNARTCRVCGTGIRATDEVRWVHDEPLHAACIEAHQAPPRRKLGAWAAMGSRGQMAMGAVQQDTRD